MGAPRAVRVVAADAVAAMAAAARAVGRVEDWAAAARARAVGAERWWSTTREVVVGRLRPVGARAAGWVTVAVAWVPCSAETEATRAAGASVATQNSPW